MDNEKLLELRARVVENAKGVASSGEIDPGSKLTILLELSKSDPNPAELLNKAFEAAQIISTDNDKLNAYLDIIYEIDSQLSSLSSKDDVADNTST